MIFERESDFEEAVIGVLKQHGWNDAGGVLRHPTEKDLLRNWADILFANNADIDRLNNCPLTKGEMAQIVEQVETLRTPLALNGFINGRSISITRDNRDDALHFGREISLKIYDRREVAGGKSRYQIAQQPHYAASDRLASDRRGDLCLLINGMPVIHIELKKSGVPVSQAEAQIEKYAREGVFSGIFRLVQVFVAMNPDDAVYFANPGDGAFNPNYYFHWADFNNEPICAGGKPGQDEWKRFVATLLPIPMAHQLIGFYTIADNADGCLKVLRSYQYHAVSRIADTVQQCAWDEPVGTGTPGRPGGYIWHTTGSGKTMTSFKSAQLIADSKDADKVVFLMDRIELGTQSLEEYRSFADDDGDVQGTENTSVLKARLSPADTESTLIVTSIQKMSLLAGGKTQASKAELSRLADQRIVFIIDECHRSTFGDMMQDIRQSFPNALFFGFTGTPILDENERRGGTTSMVFGECLHRYTIADGIRDGNVLGFDTYMVTTYRDQDVRRAVALDQAKAHTIEEAMADPAKAKAFNHFMDKKSVPMGPELDTAGNRKPCIEYYVTSMQYGDEHREKVVEDIVEQFPVLSHGNKFHAILATSSIPEAVSYYRLLKEHAPQLNVTALFDPSIDNVPGITVKENALKEIIGDYNAAYKKEFTIPTWHLMKKDVSSRLAHKRPYGTVDTHREQRIDVLVVVNQMLTGFDSKWVNTLYLDKCIEYESIIQAFSRTNRLFGPDKPFGTIRYYRYPHTMKCRIEDAVKLYSGDRPLDLFVQKLPENIVSMNARYREIAALFAAANVQEFMRLPDSVEARRKFAKEFGELNDFLEKAKVQGFSWSRLSYTVTDDSGAKRTATCEFDGRTYLVLAQRYKELFDRRDGEPEPEVPFDIKPYLTEIDTGLIDTDYMNANFTKWLKALHADSPELAAMSEELHRSFATLSQEEQRLAELFLHDIESGDVVPEEGKTLRDYITAYARQKENTQVDKLVELLHVDRELLMGMMGMDLDKRTINEFGRFDNLYASVDREHAKAALEARAGHSMTPFAASRQIDALLRRFVLEGGFDIDE